MRYFFMLNFLACSFLRLAWLPNGNFELNGFSLLFPLLANMTAELLFLNAAFGEELLRLRRLGLSFIFPILLGMLEFSSNFIKLARKVLLGAGRVTPDDEKLAV